MTLPENLARDGFQVAKKVFINPSNTTLLDPINKRKITICNHFANAGLSMGDIVRVLDEKYDHVVTVRIEQGLIQERRKSPRPPIQAERSRFLLRRFR